MIEMARFGHSPSANLAVLRSNCCVWERHILRNRTSPNVSSGPDGVRGRRHAAGGGRGAGHLHGGAGRAVVWRPERAGCRRWRHRRRRQGGRELRTRDRQPTAPSERLRHLQLHSHGWSHWFTIDWLVIPRLHDQAGLTSWLYVSWTSQLDICSIV